ncbi:MAG: dihydroorotate dehydrogenase electron transfer subunit [Candidatus Altiarchaeota archaeon]
MVKILGTTKMADDIVTITVPLVHDARPGQFSMLWLPGVGEKPFSYSRIGKNDAEFTIASVGKYTSQAVNLKEGDRIGVRGPYGNGFKIKGKNVCVVGGGVGTAPLLPLLQSLSAQKVKSTIVFGYKSKGRLIFVERIKEMGLESHISTEDGCVGTKGYCSDVFDDLVTAHRFDHVYSCGPEPMMKRVLDICVREKIPGQYSIERYMKCGYGICGQCTLDPSGLLVCLDGPVFSNEQLIKTEFGLQTRDAAGCRCKI